MAGEVYYRGGPTLIPMPGDVRIDLKTGLVRTTHGLSVYDCSDGLDRFGGAYRVDSIPATLKVVQRGRDPHHHEIVPASAMTRDEYEEALSLTVLIAV